jgi:hypothetical protein
LNFTVLAKTPREIKSEVPAFVASLLQGLHLLFILLDSLQPPRGPEADFIKLANEAYELVSRAIISAKDSDALSLLFEGLDGLRLALTGPFMTNALVGGGGTDGFWKMIEVWSKDME